MVMTTILATIPAAFPGNLTRDRRPHAPSCPHFTPNVNNLDYSGAFLRTATAHESQPAVGAGKYRVVPVRPDSIRSIS